MLRFHFQGESNIAAPVNYLQLESMALGGLFLDFEVNIYYFNPLTDNLKKSVPLWTQTSQEKI